MPGGLTYVADSLSVSGPSGWTPSTYDGLQTLSVSGLNVPANGTVTITIDAMVPTNATSGQIDSQATITGMDAVYGGPNILSDETSTGGILGDSTELTITEAEVEILAETGTSTTAIALISGLSLAAVAASLARMTLTVSYKQIPHRIKR